MATRVLQPLFYFLGAPQMGPPVQPRSNNHPLPIQSRVRLEGTLTLGAMSTRRCIEEPLVQLVAGTWHIIKHVALKLAPFACWLLLSFKTGLKTALFIALGSPKLGMMSSLGLIGGHKIFNTIRGVSHRYEDHNEA